MKSIAIAAITLTLAPILAWAYPHVSKYEQYQCHLVDRQNPSETMTTKIYRVLKIDTTFKNIEYVLMISSNSQQDSESVTRYFTTAFGEHSALGQSIGDAELQTPSYASFLLNPKDKTFTVTDGWAMDDVTHLPVDSDFPAKKSLSTVASADAYRRNKDGSIVFLKHEIQLTPTLAGYLMKGSVENKNTDSQAPTIRKKEYSGSCELELVGP